MVIFFHFWSTITCTNISKSTFHCRRTSIYSDKKINHSGHRHLPQMSTATLILQMSAPMSVIMLKKRKLLAETHWLWRLSNVIGHVTIRAIYVVFGPLEIKLIKYQGVETFTNAKVGKSEVVWQSVVWEVMGQGGATLTVTMTLTWSWPWCNIHLGVTLTLVQHWH